MSNRLVDQFGNPIGREALDTQQSAHIPWLTHQIAAHPARNLTPARLNDILQEAEFGFLIRQHELFRDMEERDSHLFAEMMKRKRSVIRLNWDVQPPRNPSKDEEALTAFAREQLIDMTDFEDLLFNCLDAVGNGFVGIELEWARLGNTWVISKHHWRPQYWFQLDHETRMEINLRDGTPDGAPLTPFGWILHRHKAVSGYTARQGLMRVLVWPYLFKHFAIGDLAEFLDIYGLPIRVGKYPKNATEAERAVLMRAVMGLGHNAGGIIPQAMAIEFQEAAKGTDAPYLAMISTCERAQSKAIVGQTMSAEAHASGLGSGNAQLHAEVRSDIRDADCKMLAATLSAQLIYPILAINKGFTDIRRCPRLVFDSTEAEDIAVYSQAFLRLGAAGMQIPLAFAHEKLHIPMPSAGEPVLKIAVNDVQPLREVRSLAAASAWPPPALPGKVSDARLAHADALDVAIEQALTMLGKDLPAQGQALARGALSAVMGAADFGTALATLSAKHVDVDDAVLIETIARAMFVCELLGIDAVQREINL